MRWSKITQHAETWSVRFTEAKELSLNISPTPWATNPGQTVLFSWLLLNPDSPTGERWMMIPPESACTAPESRGGILTYGILMCWMHITAADAMPHTWCTNTWRAAVHEVCQCVVTDSAESCLHTTRLRCDSTWPTSLIIIALTAHCGLFSSEEVSRLQLLHRWYPINMTLQSAARSSTSCKWLGHLNFDNIM